MSKKSIIIRSIIAGLMILLSIVGLFYLVISLIDATKGGWNGLAILIPVYFFIYGIPFAVATIIYQIVLIVKKKVWVVDLITSIILLVSWVSLIVVPFIFAGTMN